MKACFILIALTLCLTVHARPKSMAKTKVLEKRHAYGGSDYGGSMPVQPDVVHVPVHSYETPVMPDIVQTPVHSYETPVVPMPDIVQTPVHSYETPVVPVMPDIVQTPIVHSYETPVMPDIVHTPVHSYGSYGAPAADDVNIITSHIVPEASYVHPGLAEYHEPMPIMQRPVFREAPRLYQPMMPAY